jgi:hypothetical protein
MMYSGSERASFAIRRWYGYDKNSTTILWELVDCNTIDPISHSVLRECGYNAALEASLDESGM